MAFACAKASFLSVICGKGEAGRFLRHGIPGVLSFGGAVSVIKILIDVRDAIPKICPHNALGSCQSENLLKCADGIFGGGAELAVNSDCGNVCLGLCNVIEVFLQKHYAFTA